jgi:hypothetical protein
MIEIVPAWRRTGILIQDGGERGKKNGEGGKSSSTRKLEEEDLSLSLSFSLFHFFILGNNNNNNNNNKDALRYSLTRDSTLRHHYYFTTQP